MSALGSLKGIGCIECKRKGHYCQAQMWESCEDVDVKSFRRPMCLRCADGETCCYERVRLAQTPSRLTEELDVFELPAVTEEDLSFLAKVGKPASLHSFRKGECQGKEIREAMLRDLLTMSVADVAMLYHASKRYVWGVRAAQRRRLKELRERMVKTPVERVIGGECVRMAPMASMGAELLEG